MNMDPKISEILSFWFGQSTGDDSAIGARMPMWFGSDPAVDQAIAEHFSVTAGEAAGGDLDRWGNSPQGALALIILLDQFPRNLERGTPGAFAQDDKALKLCIGGIKSRRVRDLSHIEQVFFMMPLQHSESRRVQLASVEQFEALLTRIPEARREHFEGFAKYAHMHNDIVQRFGRFPHRNAIFGRPDTQEEKDYLAGNAPRFGQK